MAKYYAVRKGFKTGIFTSWEECKMYIDGYSSAEYKTFTNLSDAEAYIYNKEYRSFDNIDILAYVDGSFNSNKKIYSYGCVIIANNKVVKKLSGVDHKYVEMNNVAGEILASLKSIEWAIANNYHSIMIFHDYEGIQKWADNEWKANKTGTKEYKKLITSYRKKIDIYFNKIKAHSGDKYNEMADKLASQAIASSDITDNSNQSDIKIIFDKIFKTNKKTKNNYSIVIFDYEVTEAKLKKFVEEVWHAKGNYKSDIESIQLKIIDSLIRWEVTDKNSKISIFEYSI